MIAGLRVLLVEDEALIAMTAEDMLVELGCAKVAIAYSLSEARDKTRLWDYDVALLDINLNGEQSLSLAAELQTLGRPFVFTSGYGSEGVGTGFPGVPLVPKPYRAADLARAIRCALGKD